MGGKPALGGPRAPEKAPVSQRRRGDRARASGFAGHLPLSVPRARSGQRGAWSPLGAQRPSVADASGAPQALDRSAGRRSVGCSVEPTIRGPRGREEAAAIRSIQVRARPDSSRRRRAACWCVLAASSVVRGLENNARCEAGSLAPSSALP
jgi:hypothetical protein